MSKKEGNTSLWARYWDVSSVAQTAHRNENILSLIIKGLQAMLVMFGATIIVPMNLGMSPQTTLFGMGVGTIIFLILTKGKSPLMMGSSFAFMIGIMSVIDPAYGPLAGRGYTQDERLAYALGGVIVAGAVYLVLSLIVKLVGANRFMKALPSVVTGPTVVLIGVILAPHAIEQFSANWILGPLTLIIIIVVMIFGKGKRIGAFPVLIGLGGAYFIAVLMQLAGATARDGGELISIAMEDVSFFGLPPFITPRFALVPILMLVPFSLATAAENIVDNGIAGDEMGEDLLRDKPGLSRTLFADGIQSMLVAAFGTPMNTTYSENVGLLIITKVFSSVVVAIGAGFAILLGLSPAFAEVINSIPIAIIGGASFMLYGMIASIGMRTIKKHVDLDDEKNLIIVSVMLVIGIGMRFVRVPIVVNIADQAVRLDRMNIAIAIIAGVALNLIFILINWIFTRIAGKR